MSAQPLISCRDLIPDTPGFDYHGAGLTLNVNRGDIVTFVGPDYTGKSSWLRTLTGVTSPVSGELELLGKNVDDFERQDWVKTRTSLGYVKSDTTILSATNALFNVVLPARYHDLGTAKELVKPATKLLFELGIYDLSSLPAYLRRDQRFKIAIARALILEPQALILDNPFYLLDAIASENLQQHLLKRNHQMNMGLLLVTHDVNFAIKHSNQIVFVTQEQLYLFDRDNRIQDCGLDFVIDYLNKNRMTC